MDWGSRPWGRKELDTIEWLHFHFSLYMEDMILHVENPKVIHKVVYKSWKNML